MRTQAEKSQIKMFLQSPQWQLIEQIVKELIQKIRDQSNLRETEWETAKSVALEEGQVQGINNLIQELYRIAQNTDA